MLNVHDLERRWLKYKIKSYLPLLLSALGSIIVVVLLIVYLPLSKEKNEKAVETVLPKEQIKIEKSAVQTESKPLEKEKTRPPLEVPQNTQKQAEGQKNIMRLKPSLRFMDNIEEGIDPYLEEQYTAPDTAALSSLEETETEPIGEVETPQAEMPVEKRQKKLTITKNKNDSDLKDVIRRFKKNKNPALSLFVAKRYYELEQYQKSYNYALMTNEIDKNIDESWIIFSKSLVKLGQHELATVTLKSYLKTTKSTPAEVLLRKIESGDFR